MLDWPITFRAVTVGNSSVVVKAMMDEWWITAALHCKIPTFLRYRHPLIATPPYLYNRHNGLWVNNGSDALASPVLYKRAVYLLMSSESSPSSKTTLNAALEVYFYTTTTRPFPGLSTKVNAPRATPSKYAKSSSMHVVLVLLYHSNRPWTPAYRNIQEILHCN